MEKQSNPPCQSSESRGNGQEYQQCQINDFWKNKYMKESNKSWNLFYKRNKSKFFKDRHWTDREFSELQKPDDFLVILEVGCGVGNFILPLLEKNKKMIAYCCDVSQVAVDLLKEQTFFIQNADRCFPFQCDIIKDPLENYVPSSVKMDLVSLIFILSAIPPESHIPFIKNISKLLISGKSIILFRDYGVNDHAHLRFGNDRKINDNLFVRQDGTLSFFFSKEYATAIFQHCGFKELENDYVYRRTINIKENLDVERIFLQGRWLFDPNPNSNSSQNIT